MQGQVNPKIVGAAVIGFALIGGAYVLSSLGQDRIQPQQASVVTVDPSPRVPITVVDADGNGIEDWRDEFVTTDPILLSSASTTDYVEPDTLTGEVGINFFQNIIRARGYGPFGATDEEVIDSTVGTLTEVTAHELYDTPDIVVLSEWTDEDVVLYANTLASTILRNDLPNLEGELFILEDVVTTGNTGRLPELESLAEGYKRNRDDTLNIAVPAFMVKEHLDLINTFHAVHKDIEAMTMALDDPAFTLLRLKRYEDDATGLAYALQNMFFALDDYAHLFTTEDPAALFVIFSPDYQPVLPSN